MKGSLIYQCDGCGGPLRASGWRTITTPTGRIRLCKLCFLKLPQKDRANSKAQTKLRHEVTYTQAELPF